MHLKEFLKAVEGFITWVWPPFCTHSECDLQSNACHS